MPCHNCTCHQCIIEPSLGLSPFMIVIIASLHHHCDCHRFLKEKHGSGAVVALIGLSPWFQPLDWLNKDLRLLKQNKKTTRQSSQYGRVAELGSLSSGAKIAMKIFVKRVFTIFASNVSFLHVIAYLQN